MFNQAKMIMKIKKAQKELANEIIEVEAGDGAVVVRITGEQKIKNISIDPEQVDLEDIHELERWIETAVKEAILRSQQVAAEKMKPLMGGLGNLGL
ncbi:MAG TPA: YbaB/EbfC family nucleoid-associated protein [Candidatus Saccharimonadales bacterium]|jgi:nucleoid-associated protein EbfC|nr:YbaB/EbfC family nucleoid-associated protein [Candidatus Saccharimonadales bacterium]